VSVGATAFHDETQQATVACGCPAVAWGNRCPSSGRECGVALRVRNKAVGGGRRAAAEFTLLERHAGGGTRLTKRGKDVVTKYHQFRRHVDLGVERQFTRTFRG
jgi:hypothetical protein